MSAARKGVFLKLKKSTVGTIKRRAKEQDTTHAKIVDAAIEASEPVVTVNGSVARRAKDGSFRVVLSSQ